MRALVVDDSSVMRKILTNILARVGITDVTEAADGAEAVKVVEAEEFGLVLMDWNMPKMLGIDAVKVIRANGKRMPIIMVTTEADKIRIIEAIKAGATNYVIKPFDQNLVVSKLQEILAKAAAAR